jgi:dihydroorotate dehydrogenase (fumarate)
MAGADVVQMVSALLRHGPEHVRTVLHELQSWMEEHEYESVSQMRGSMNLERSPNAAAFERTNYMRTIHSWGL